MATLNYVDLPEVNGRGMGAIWRSYVPLVTSFLESGRPSALIEDDGVKPEVLGGRVRSAIFHMYDVQGRCKVVVRQGRPYLVRTDMAVEP